jgi:hypothetical protein
MMHVADRDGFRQTLMQDQQPIAIGFNQPPADMLKAGIKPKDTTRARCRGAILADQPRQGFMEAWC